MTNDKKHPMRILLVEDTLIAQEVIMTLLTNEGCVVDTAIDGQMALALAIETRYDLILMDIRLGDGPDGFDVTSEIKKHSIINKATPIIAVTAHGEPEYHSKAIASGMEGYVQKPFTPEDARDVIEYMKEKFGYL